MIEYGYQLNRELVICPYCENSYPPAYYDYDECGKGEGEVGECEECGKKYRIHHEMEITHRTTADCEINGQEHEYKGVSLEKGKKHPFCAVCGKIKAIGGWKT